MMESPEDRSRDDPTVPREIRTDDRGGRAARAGAPGGRDPGDYGAAPGYRGAARCAAPAADARRRME